MGELKLIEKFRARAPIHPWITVGPGQDCAALKWPSSSEILFKIDQVVEGTHFLLEGLDAAKPFEVGWKAMAKGCSDIAAAGGEPVAAAVAMNIRKGTPEATVLKVYDGLAACCRRFKIGLAGGDFSASKSALSIVVSLLGRCEKGAAWTRAGAKPGDLLFVTGSLGGSRLRKHLRFTPRLQEAKRIRQLCDDGVHACIDITDGLSRDLRHICDESECGARIEQERVPLSRDALKLSSDRSDAFYSALSDGEDFELLLAIAPATSKRLLKRWNLTTRLTHIGEIVPRARGLSLISNGIEGPLPDVGYEHRV